MTYLPNLIKKIDEFCQRAEDFSTIRRMAAPNPWDDPNFGMENEAPSGEGEATTPHFDELMDAARQVDDPELSEQLTMLAELYRYSLQMGGGYATISRAINNLKDMYSDGSDSGIEYILNGMIKELAKAAGGIKNLSGSDNPSFVQRLAQLKQDIESRNLDERSEALDAYNEEISGAGKGAQTGESEEDLAQAGLTPEQAEIINPAALGFGNKEDPKTNKGWHTVGSGIPYKNWKEYYNNERISYATDLASETDPDNRKVLDELIRLLPIISNKTAEALDLSNVLKTDVDKPEEQAKIKAQLDAKRKELQQYKALRQQLKNRIRSSQLQKGEQKLAQEAQVLAEKLNSSDPERREKARREIELIKQKSALNTLAQSNDVYKAKKRNYILEMVRSMSGGAWPSQDWINKQQQKIDEAKTVKKIEYDRIQTLDRAKEHGKIGPVPKRPSRPGGGGGVPKAKIHQYDIGTATFNGLVDKFSEKINTSAHVARLNVTQEINADKKKVHNQLKPFVDAISKAIQKKDNQAKYEAIKALKVQMVDWSNRATAIKALSRNVKWLPFFNRIKTDFEMISSWKKETGWDLNENKKIFIAHVIRGADRIVEAYGRYYRGQGKGAGTTQLEISFDNTVKFLEMITQQLSSETRITGQETI
jgi:hypothetical protein